MRAIAGLTVVCPADCGEIVKTVHAAAAFDGPMYIRLTGGPNCPVVYTEDYDFQIGRAVELKQGNRVAIVANGSMVAPSLAATEELANVGISAGVYNFHTVKPLDVAMLTKICENYEVIITVEEHSVVGGLGGAVAEATSSWAARPPVHLHGLPDMFGKTGEYEFLLNRYGLTTAGIVEKVRTLIA